MLRSGFPYVLWLLLIVVDAKLSCMDNNNNPVSWFVIYKLPVHDQTSLKYEFPAHLYMDDNSPKFTKIEQSLNETSQSVAYTLAQAYKNHRSGDVGYIMYNDEKPEGAGGAVNFTSGHTKGVAIFDGYNGIWLVHSVPKFPPPSNMSYMYPDNGVYYGQHMLCVTLGSSTDVSYMGLQLLHNEPFIYDSNLPLKLVVQYPVMKAVISENKPTTTTSVLVLNAKQKQTFASFAKSGDFSADLYAGLVSDSLKCDLAVETWQHDEKDNLPSVCDQKYQVRNVLNIAQSDFEIKFSNYEDHSKFAACVNGSASWVCIGDINRQFSQMKRGGGTVCFKNTLVHQEYLKLIANVQDCPANS